MSGDVARIAPVSAWLARDGYALMRLMKRPRMSRGHTVYVLKATPLRTRRLFSLYQTFVQHTTVRYSQVEHARVGRRQVFGQRSHTLRLHLDPRPNRLRFAR